MSKYFDFEIMRVDCKSFKEGLLAEQILSFKISSQLERETKKRKYM